MIKYYKFIVECLCGQLSSILMAIHEFCLMLDLDIWLKSMVEQNTGIIYRGITLT